MRLKGTRLIDGVNDTAVQARITFGSTVTSIDPIADAMESASTDAYTVLPGLIDAHVHLSLSGELFEGWRNDLSRAYYAMRAYRNAQDHLDSGVTTVRDLGGIGDTAIQIRNGIKLGIVGGPLIRSSGRWLCTTGGHGAIYGSPADGYAGFARAAREEIAAGADLIKVMATAGALAEEGRDPNTTELEPEEMQAIADVAAAASVPVAVHAHSEDAALLAIRNGAASIEHGTWLSERTIDAMLEHGTTLIPTLTVMDYVGANDPAQQAIIDRMSGDKFTWLTRAIAANVKVATGTDAGAPNTPHGLVRHEIARLVELGMSPMKALQAGTAVAGQLVTAGQRGALQVGAPADLLIVRGNPLESIGALGNVVCVIQNGVVVRGAVPQELNSPQ